MSTNLSLVQFENACRLNSGNGKPCGYKFANHPLRIPIIGEPPEERAVKILEKMGEHVMKSHIQLLDSITTEARRVYVPFRVASQFDIQDPNAVHHLKILRAQIIAAAGKPFLSDDQLRERMAAVGALKPESVFVLLSTLRDVLCEIAPPKPASEVVMP